MLLHLLVLLFSRPSAADSGHRSAARARLPEPERFPLYGTPEFEEQCAFAVGEIVEGIDKIDCVRVVKSEHTNEGIAYYMAESVKGYIEARSTGCLLQFDYGEGVDINQAWVPPEGAKDWADPEKHLPGMTAVVEKCMGEDEENLKKNQDNQCALSFRTAGDLARRRNRRQIGAPIIRNRHAAITDPARSYSPTRTQFQYHSKILPGFDATTHFACAMGAMLRPAPHLYTPEVNAVLSKVRDTNNLVISIYVRTQLSELMGKGLDQAQHLHTPFNGFEQFPECALHVESMLAPGFDNVIWLVISNSKVVRQKFQDKYHKVEGVEGKTWSREVLITSTDQGQHSRLRKGNGQPIKEESPGNKVVSEALLDFFMIGESDAVVADTHYSFGSLAAERTKRPLWTTGSHHPKYHVLSPCVRATAYDTLYDTNMASPASVVLPRATEAKKEL